MKRLIQAILAVQLILSALAQHNAVVIGNDCFSNAVDHFRIHQKRKSQFPEYYQSSQAGIFTVSSSDHLAKISALYLDRKNSFSIALNKVSRFTSSDIDVNLGDLRQNNLSEFNRLKLRGIKLLKGKLPGSLSVRNELKIIKKYGFENFSSLSILTSGAGLWSRGGGQVKALIPLNLKSLLTESEFKQLAIAGQIVSAKNELEVLIKSGHETGGLSEKEIAQISEQLSIQAKKKIQELILKARKDQFALNILDLKIAEIAQKSRISKSYIHFDIWTSEQTHFEIKDYLKLFKESYKNKKFHPDSKINNKIIKDIENYLSASSILGETHLFGYQKGIFALDPSTGLPLTHTTAIGEGAGMAKHYLDDSKRTVLLSERGVENWVFQNIEVSGNIMSEYTAFIESGKKVGVILVPTQKGYSGGSPYIVKNNDGVQKMLLEGSAVPSDLADGNDFFNTNTIYQSLSLKGPENIGFEAKENGRIQRAKMNAGDITLEYSTSMISGEVKLNYENFKNYEEYGVNGPEQITVIQARLVD